VRLAATEEAGNPRWRRFVLLAQRIDEGLQDSAQALFVMALADEGFEFEAQGLSLLLVERLIDFGDALVFQREGVDVLVEQVAVAHGLFHRRDQQVIGTAR